MARRFQSRKPRRSSNEGDYFTDAELQQIKPHKKMFDPSVLDAILHGTNPMEPVIPQPDAHPVHKALNEPSPAEIYIQPIPVPGLQNKIHTTKKHRLNSNKTKTQKSNIPQPIKHQRFSSVPPVKYKKIGKPNTVQEPNTFVENKSEIGVEWHQGKLISKSTGEVLSSSSFMHGKSGSHRKGRGYNSQVAKNEWHRRARGRGH